MLFQLSFDPLRQHRYPILPAFSVPDHNLIEFKIDIFYPQAQAFEQTHSGPEKQGRDQLMCSTHDPQNSLYLVFTQDQRTTLRPLRSLDVAKLAERFLQDPMIKKYQRVKRLFLGVSGNFFAHRQVGQIKLHFQSPHFSRVLFIVIKDIPANPAHISLLGAD